MTCEREYKQPHEPYGVEHAPNNKRKCYPPDRCRRWGSNRQIRVGDLVLRGQIHGFSVERASGEDVEHRYVAGGPKWAHWECIRGFFLGDIRSALNIKRDGSGGAPSVNWGYLDGYDTMDANTQRRIHQTLLPGQDSTSKST